MATKMTWTLLAEVPSSSNPSKKYRVAVDGHGRLGCSCPAWVFGRARRCKHLTKLAIACIPPILDGLAELNALKARA